MSDIIDIRTRQAKPKPEAAKAPPPWFRFFAADFVASTRGLSAAETGILIRLVANMHARGEPLAEDHARLARLCGTVTLNFRRALECLLAEGLVIRAGGGLWSPMVQAEADFRRAASARRDKRISAESSTKSTPENDRVSEFQKEDRRNGLDGRSPSGSLPTFEGRRGSRRHGAPPSQAPNREPQTFRVGGWRRNASGDHYEVLAVDVEAHTVTVRFTETGIEQTTNAPAGAVLIPSDDDLDDEIPF